jgi:hypothetical protein
MPISIRRTEGRLVELHCLAISAKRYALFTINADGKPVLRKASAHGLGHLRPPYEDNDAPAHLPRPQRPLGEIGVERWQHDLWLKIIEAALAGHPDQVDLSDLANIDEPTLSRYSAAAGSEHVHSFCQNGERRIFRPLTDLLSPSLAPF